MLEFDLPIPDTTRCVVGSAPLTIPCPVCREPYRMTLAKQRGWVEKHAHVLIVCDGCVDRFCGLWADAILDKILQE
ncbi:MAG TPA: hypothetical protein VJ808_05040 [Gemmatimonadales bacterium]|nr:hypothetical protein [Gemmatimonadales bacterium]